MPSHLSGEEILENLMKCNNEHCEDTDLSVKQRKLLAKEQKPIATVLACADSRVPPEIIFKKNLGDLFVVRIAGNTVDQLALASLEYGVNYLGTPLLLILGHQNCGAVTAAFDLDHVNFGANVGALLAQIHPSIREVKAEYGDRPKQEQIQLAIQRNLHHTHRQILFRSQIIRGLVHNGKLKIQVALYQIDSGKVDWQ